MRETDAMMSRLKALTSGPTHGQTGTMRGHLHDAFCAVSGEDFDPLVMWQQAGPGFHRTRDGENVVHISTYRDAVFRVHTLFLSRDALQRQQELVGSPDRPAHALQDIP
jgi:hypothetical protein